MLLYLVKYFIENVFHQLDKLQPKFMQYQKKAGECQGITQGFFEIFHCSSKSDSPIDRTASRPYLLSSYTQKIHNVVLKGTTTALIPLFEDIT